MYNKTTNKQLFYLTLLLFFAITSAVSLDVHAQSNPLKIVVANQGNFSDANGSLTYFESGAATASQDIVPGLNTLIQSVLLQDRTGYILSNTADRIDIFNLDTFERTGQITGVSSPRYMAVVGTEKAYVSNLFTESVTIIDLASNTVTGTVATGKNPEDIAVIGNNAYVANSGFGADDSTLTVIDIATDSVIDTMQTGCDGPRFLEVDNDNELWVFCNGKTVFNADFSEIIEQTNGQVVVFHGATGEEVVRIPLDAQSGASSLGQDAWYDPVTQQMFLVVGAEVVVFDTVENEQQMAIQIDGDEQIGGIAYESTSDRLYVARITDFTSSGFVSIHDLSGMETGRFSAGVAPAFIAFYPAETSVAVEDEASTTHQYALLDTAYPNPAIQDVTIPVTIQATGYLSLDVYNALGQKVAVLMDGVYAAGEYAVPWSAGSLPRGMYFYRLSTAQKIQTKQITLVR